MNCMNFLPFGSYLRPIEKMERGGKAGKLTVPWTPKFNVNSSIFEVESEKVGLDSNLARDFMQKTYGESYISLDDVEDYVKAKETQVEKQKTLAVKLLDNLMATHNRRIDYQTGKKLPSE